MLSSGSTAHSAVAAEAAEQARKNKLKRQQRQLSLEPDNEGNIGARNIVFSKFDEVEREVLRHPDRVSVACIGVSWLQMSTYSLTHVMQAKQHKTFPNLKFYLIDAEHDRSFCHHNRLIVGTPALMAWVGGKNITFERSGWPPSPVVVGHVSPEKLRAFEKAIGEALDENGKLREKAVAIKF